MKSSIFDSIIGNEQAKLDLKNALNSKKIPHSWLISGPKSIGKSSLIYLFIQELFKNIPNVSGKMEKEILSDFLKITSKDGKDINVKDIRAIGKFLSLTAAQENFRVVMIDGAEDMNKHGANALLKILEEPPANVIIFLISHNPEKLLSTLTSRCRHLKMHPLSKKDCEKILQIEISDNIFYLSGGSPGMIKELISMNAENLYKEILEIISSKQNNKLYTLLVDYKMFEENWQVANSIINSIMQNIIKIITSQKYKDSLNFDTKNLLEKISKEYSLQEWFVNFDNINKIWHEANLLNLDKKHTLLVVFNILSRT